uniref:Uncharacterized protein n=1 Tax=Anguilla anguilla TaxID=7936 RepID=A0A0E9W012_ANGAN
MFCKCLNIYYLLKILNLNHLENNNPTVLLVTLYIKMHLDI